MSTDHMMEPDRDPIRPSRRQTVRAAGAAGVLVAGTATVAACGAGASVESAARSAVGSATAAASSAAAEAIAAADIPVGGGRVFESLKVVVTQPTQGQYKAFSSVCTHRGCQVEGVENGVIACPCHGSRFDMTTGAVVQGPAKAPLPPKQVTVSGDGLSVS